MTDNTPPPPPPATPGELTEAEIEEVTMADVAAAIAETCPSHSPPIQCSLEKGHPGYHKLMEGATLVATWDDPEPASPGGLTEAERIPPAASPWSSGPEGQSIRLSTETGRCVTNVYEDSRGWHCNVYNNDCDATLHHAGPFDSRAGAQIAADNWVTDHPGKVDWRLPDAAAIRQRKQEPATPTPAGIAIVSVPPAPAEPWTVMNEPATPGGEVADEVRARLRADLAAARERLGMATRFALPDGVRVVRDDFDGDQWLIYRDDDGYEMTAAGRWTPNEDDGARFPTADAAFDALAATRGTTETPHE